MLLLFLVFGFNGQVRFFGVLLASLALLGCQSERAPKEKLAQEIKKGDFVCFEFEGRSVRGFATSDARPREGSTCPIHGLEPGGVQFGFLFDPSVFETGSSPVSTAIASILTLPETQTVRTYSPSPDFREDCLGFPKKSRMKKFSDLIAAKYLGAGWQGDITNGAAVITGYTGPGGVVKFPSRWKGVPVRQIGTGMWNPLHFEEPVTEIVIPEGTTHIADYAFQGQSSLTNIVLPKTLIRIGVRGFDDCEGLQQIKIPENVADIGEGAFSWCLQLKRIEVEVGNPAYSSKDGVLYNKGQSLLIQFPAGRHGEFTIPEHVTGIGDGAFRYATNLTRVVIPTGMKTIGSFAFELCSSMSNVLIPESVTNLGEGAFAGCLGLRGFLVATNHPYFSIQGGVLHNKEGTSLIQYAYGRQETSFFVPEGVLEIGSYAFWNCTNLTVVTLPESVTKIGQGAFQFARNLQEVKIPNSATKISEDAFDVNSRLTPKTLLRIQEIQLKRGIPR